MAEFLLFNKDHWTKGKPEETQEKFLGCYKKGDVVEVREDGYWDTRGFNKKAFCVIKIPKMPLKDAQKYMGPLEVPDGIEYINDEPFPKYKIVATRKYRFDVTEPNKTPGLKAEFSKIEDIDGMEKTEETYLDWAPSKLTAVEVSK